MVSRIDNITSVPDIEDPKVKIRYSETEYNRLLRTYLETVQSQKQFPQGSELNDFFGLVHNAIISRQNSEGVPSTKRILFLEEDPPNEDEVDTEAITFILRSRVPGRFDQGPAGAGRIKEVTGHQRSIIEHPEHPGEKLVTMGRFYDNWITFNIYARTAKAARNRLLWFERMMDAFTWYYRLHGFRVIEEGCGDKESVKLGELEITKYPISFMVRTDDTFHISTQELRSVVFNIGVSRQ